jgi:hypothetical protein
LAGAFLIISPRKGVWPEEKSVERGVFQAMPVKILKFAQYKTNGQT